MIRVHLTGLTHPKTIRISYRRVPKLELVPKVIVTNRCFFGQREARWENFGIWGFDVYALGCGRKIGMGAWRPPVDIRVDEHRRLPHGMKHLAKQAAMSLAGRLSTVFN